MSIIIPTVIILMVLLGSGILLLTFGIYDKKIIKIVLGTFIILELLFSISLFFIHNTISETENHTIRIEKRL